MEDLARAAADGIDHDVDPPEPGERLLDHPIAVGLVGRVDRHGQPLRARRLDPLDRHQEGRLRPTRHGHPSPGAREASAIGAPMPPPPPTTNATRPSRLNMSSRVIVLLPALSSAPWALGERPVDR